MGFYEYRHPSTTWEETNVKEILLHLQELFGEQSRTTRYEISKRLFRAKMKEGEDVGAHMNSIIHSIEELQSLDFMMNAQL